METAFAWQVGDPSAADVVVEAERLGVSSAWVPEMWGQDAFTPVAFLAARTATIKLGTAIAQIGPRTPTATAMAAMSLQALSAGRFLLGLGSSGPQVMEGWHGIPFADPVTATRETVEIVRAVARGDRLDHAGKAYQIPLPGGRGRPMRSMMAPVTVPVYLASLGPRNLRLTGEVADGWIGTAFVPERAGVFLDELAAGASRSGRTLADLDLVIPVAVEFTDDVDEAARRHARGYAFTLGAMGPRGQNFYASAFERQGYGDDVRAVQELWLAGRRDEAADRVPAEIGFKTNLIGPPAMIKERLRLYRDAGITTLQMKMTAGNSRNLDALARFAELVAAVSAEGTEGTEGEHT